MNLVQNSIEAPEKTLSYSAGKALLSLARNGFLWPFRLVSGRSRPWDLEVIRQSHFTILDCFFPSLSSALITGFAYTFLLEANIELGIAAKGVALGYFGKLLLTHVIPVSMANFVVNRGALNMGLDMAKAVRDGEWDALAMRGVDPLDSVFFPKALAMILVAPALAVFGVLGVALGSYAATSLVTGTGASFQEFSMSLFKTSGISDVVMVPVKTAVIALVTCSIAAQCGLPLERQREAPGTVATRVIGWSVTSIVITNAALSLIIDLIKRIE